MILLSFGKGFEKLVVLIIDFLATKDLQSFL